MIFSVMVNMSVMTSIQMQNRVKKQSYMKLIVLMLEHTSPAPAARTKVKIYVLFSSAPAARSRAKLKLF